MQCTGAAVSRRSSSHGYPTCMLLVLYKSAQASYITGVVIDVVHLRNLVLTGLSLCKDMLAEGQLQKIERR